MQVAKPIDVRKLPIFFAQCVLEEAILTIGLFETGQCDALFSKAVFQNSGNWGEELCG